jgi:hypothetical protein
MDHMKLTKIHIPYSNTKAKTQRICCGAVLGFVDG